MVLVFGVLYLTKRDWTPLREKDLEDRARFAKEYAEEQRKKGQALGVKEEEQQAINRLHSDPETRHLLYHWADENTSQEVWDAWEANQSKVFEDRFQKWKFLLQ